MKTLRIASIFMLAFLLAVGSLFAGGAKETAMAPGKQFLIYDYWTAGGEKQAIDALFDMFRQ